MITQILFFGFQPSIRLCFYFISYYCFNVFTCHYQQVMYCSFEEHGHKVLKGRVTVHILSKQHTIQLT